MVKKAIEDLIEELDENTRLNIGEISLHKGPLVLVDLSYHIYRYFYAHRHLGVKSDGFFLPTGHIHGVTKMVCNLRMDLLDPYIIMVMDGRDTKRKEINSNYKAGRADKEFAVGSVSKDILAIISSLNKGVYMSYNPVFEADDGLYSIALFMSKLLEKHNITKDIYIYTSDKDLYQCVGNNIYVIKSYKNSLKGAEFINSSDVLEDFGVYPDRLVHYRALVGDSSDNLKGYHRIPRKVASKLARVGIFTERGLVIPEGREVDLTQSEAKWIGIINNDYKIFYDNFRIMKLKFYPFKISKLNYGPEESNMLIDKYKLNSFKEFRNALNG